MSLCILVLSIVYLSAFVLSRYFVTHRGRLDARDEPNVRSLHAASIPRNGGIAIVISLLFGGFVSSNVFDEFLALSILPGVTILFMVAFFDDRGHVSAIFRLVLQFLAVILFLWFDNGFSKFSFLYFFVIIVCGAWSINLYNFMDGMDGFAGSMGVIGFSALSALFFLNDLDSFGFYCVLIVSAVLAFLHFNWPPAKLFMGDAGSTVLGYMVFCFSFILVSRTPTPVWVPLLIFSPFWVDATNTLLRRMSRGEKIWLPHRTHYYQRLVLMGWGHKKTLVVEVLLMVGCAFSALLGTFLGSVGQWLVGIVWITIYTWMIWAFRKMELRHNSNAA